MQTVIDKNLGTLVLIYDFLNGGYFFSYHQLQFYNEKAYRLYLKNNKKALVKLYKQLCAYVPSSVLSSIENSPGIRYFCCDCCHDAKIQAVYIDGGYLTILLDTDGMLGCLNVDKTCKIKLRTNSEKVIKKIIEDSKIFEKLFWLSSNIIFDDDVITFELELQTFIDSTCRNIKYEFIIDDIVIE